jgi:hypothetical protein
VGSGLITHNRLYAEICSFENLLLAAHRAEHGKRMQDTIGRFRTDLEAELAGLPANVPMTFRFNQNALGNFYLMWSVRRIP